MGIQVWSCGVVYTLTPEENGCHIADDIWIFKDKGCILFKISLKYVPDGPICSKSELI